MKQAQGYTLTSLKSLRVGNRHWEFTLSIGIHNPLRAGRIAGRDHEHREGIAAGIDGEKVLCSTLVIVLIRNWHASITFPPTVTELAEKKIPAGVDKVDIGIPPMPFVDVNFGAPKDPSLMTDMAPIMFSETLLLRRKYTALLEAQAALSSLLRDGQENANAAASSEKIVRNPRIVCTEVKVAVEYERGHVRDRSRDKGSLLLLNRTPKTPTQECCWVIVGSAAFTPPIQRSSRQILS